MVLGRSALVFLLLGACSGGRDPVGDDDPDVDKDPDDTDDTDQDTDEDDPDYPDPFEDLGPEEACESFEGYPIPAATSWWVGEFERHDENVRGTETWVLFANERWVELGGADCVIVWDVTGTFVEPESCLSCDFGLQLEADVNDSRSDCPPDIYAGDESFEVAYDVRITSDGRSQFYFADTGNELGAWRGDEEAFAYVSAPSCSWF